MKVLILNGSPRFNGNTALAIKEMESVFQDEGIEFETIQVGNKDIRGCIACGACKREGKCVFDDCVNEISAKFEKADGLIVASPVYYASANATLVALLQRIFHSTSFDKTMLSQIRDILEVCENGADIIDTAIEPLSWGKVHPDIISVLAMLRQKGFEVPEINMSAYMKARSLTQQFITLDLRTWLARNLLVTALSLVIKLMWVLLLLILLWNQVRKALTNCARQWVTVFISLNLMVFMLELIPLVVISHFSVKDSLLKMVRLFVL